MTVKSVHAKLIGHAHKDIGKDHAASASSTTLLVQRIDVFQRQQALGALTLHGQRKHARYDRVHSSKYTRDGAGSSAPAAICRERCRKINKHARRRRAQLDSAPEPMATGKVKASRLRDDESRSIRTGINLRESNSEPLNQDHEPGATAPLCRNLPVYGLASRDRHRSGATSYRHKDIIRTRCIFQA
ncbi:hypothetical protein ABIB75_007753 [Bradyrhizobium sp. GM2.2]